MSVANFGNQSLLWFLGSEGSLPLWKIRKLLKKKLNEDKLASVQMDVNNEAGIPTVFLRIVTTPKIKNIKKAERNLLTVKPTFLVYFPGEQYFYADSSVPNENHCQVSQGQLQEWTEHSH